MTAHRKNITTNRNRVLVGAAGALVAFGLSSGVAGADVIEISADGVVSAQTGSTVREVGSSGTNQVRSVSRTSVLSGLPGSKIVDAIKAVPSTKACFNIGTSGDTDLGKASTLPFC